MKPASALRLLHWVVLVFVLMGLGRACAQETHRARSRPDPLGARPPLKLRSGTRTSTDADLQRLRAENDPLALALQGAVADLTPRLAASAKRLAELTPKSGEAAPTTDVAAKELESEKTRHDRLDANLRAARAMLLEADDLSTRISAARRQLFARRTFARSSSVLNPQLWAAVWREVPVDAEVMRGLIGNWLGAVGELTTLAKIGMAAIVIALALAAAPLSWLARRFVYRDPAVGAPSRLRRALAAAWIFAIFAALPLGGLGVLAGALDSFNLSDPSVQGVIDAAFEAARVLIVVNALGRGVLAPGRAAWRLIPMSDRTAAIVYRLAMTIAAIWAVERLIEPAADAAASLNIAVAARGVGAVLAALAIAYALRQLGAQPARAQGSPQNDAWTPSRTLGWAAALIIFAAALTGYIAFATFLVNQAIYLTVLGSALTIADVIVQDGTETLLRPEAPVGARVLAMAGLRRNVLAQIVGRPARRRPSGGACRCGRGGAEALGRAVAGHVRRPALRLFRLRGRRRHLVAVVVDRRWRRFRRRGVLHPADPELAGLQAVCRRPGSTPASAIRSGRSSAMSASSSPLCWPGRQIGLDVQKARPRRRRPLGRHRLRPADDRQQFRLRPHPVLGARHPRRRLGGRGDRAGVRARGSMRARPRSRLSTGRL